MSNSEKPQAQFASKYIPLDSAGRIVSYPEEGRHFIRSHKRALAFFAEYPNGRLYLGPSLDYPYVSSLAEYREANARLLDARINAAGGLTVREPRDGTWNLTRDKRAIEDLLIRRVRGVCGLETKTARKRFPDIHARMKYRE